MTPTRLRTPRGVTIIELLVVVAIMGILTMLTLPNIPEIIRGHRLRTANNDLVSKLRYIRGLAITKNRQLRVTIDTDKRTLLVTQLAYREYNLIDELNNFDINKALTDETTTTGKPALQDFTIFSEDEQPLLVVPRWDSAKQPIYEIPINYDVLQTDMPTSIFKKQWSAMSASEKNVIIQKSGIASMIVEVNGKAANPANFTFQPSGIINENRVAIGIGSKAGTPMNAMGYTITVYKGGQITSSNL
ncbi:Pilin, putative [Candidatus Moduliflexus flocculans]|uniref:Pilin, putative n=1 Tax=Candidatus Moduliflexus flocculans TaxID=1499966 RepID=A0A0S6W071_9BACT|nr:Pilin, putative [Candidatus Moduliflexus flocculans]